MYLIYNNCLQSTSKVDDGTSKYVGRYIVTQSQFETVDEEYEFSETTIQMRQFFRECYPHIIEIYRINPYISSAFIFQEIQSLKPGPFYKRWCNPETCIVVFSTRESGMLSTFLNIT